MRPLFLLMPVLAMAFAGCSSDESSAAGKTAAVYVDAVIPRQVTKVGIATGETMTLGRAIDAIGGLLPEEKEAYLQVLRAGARPIVIEVRDFDAHRADPLSPGDSVYIGFHKK